MLREVHLVTWLGSDGNCLQATCVLTCRSIDLCADKLGLLVPSLTHTLLGFGQSTFVHGHKTGQHLSLIQAHLGVFQSERKVEGEIDLV